MAYFYQKGIGVVKNLKEAVRLYILAAEQGYDHAQTHLGYMYRNGIGVEKDESKSAHYYLLGAEQGHTESIYQVLYLTFLKTKESK